MGRAQEPAKQLIGGDDVGSRTANETFAKLDTCERPQPRQRSPKRRRPTGDGTAADRGQAGEQASHSNITCYLQFYALTERVAGDPTIADSPVGEAVTKPALEPSQLPGARALKSDDNHDRAKALTDQRNINLMTRHV